MQVRPETCQMTLGARTDLRMPEQLPPQEHGFRLYRTSSYAPSKTLGALEEVGESFPHPLITNYSLKRKSKKWHWKFSFLFQTNLNIFFCLFVCSEGSHYPLALYGFHLQ